MEGISNTSNSSYVESEVEILKFQLATKFTIYNGCSADFWEFSYSEMEDFAHDTHGCVTADLGFVRTSTPESVTARSEGFVRMSATGAHSDVWLVLFACVPWSFVCVAWLISVCDWAYSYVWRDSFDCVIWLFIWDVTSYGTWLHMCDMTHAYVSDDSFKCVTWLISMRDLIYFYVWRDSFHCDMPRYNVWCDTLLCETRLISKCGMIYCYGVAATSRLLKIIGLFCKRDLKKRRYSANET